MASMVNDFENALALLLFNNTAIANIGDAGGLSGSSAAGSTQLSLHSAALSDTNNNMTTNEVSYTGYTRPTQTRNSSGWSVSGDTASNAAVVQFGSMTGGTSVTAVHCGLGFIATGNVLRLHQDLNNDLIINVGINPQFAVGELDWVFT